MRNKAVKTRIKNVIKGVNQALQAGDAERAQAALAAAIPVIDKAASKGVIHKRTASRKISRLSKHVHRLSSA